MRVAKFVTIIDIRPTVIVEVSPRAFHAIVESAALHIVEFRRKSIPLLRRWPRLLVLLRRWRRVMPEFRTMSAHQVRHRAIVSAPEPIAKCLALFRRKMRVAKNLMVIHIGVTIRFKSLRAASIPS